MRLAFSTPPIGKGMEVDDDMKPFTIHVSLVDTPASDTLFEGHTWGWYCIDRRAAVSQNHNELSFKKWLNPPKPFLHWHIPTLSPYQMVENCSSPTNIQGYKGGRYCSVGIWISTTIFRSMAFNVHLLCMKEGCFLACHPLLSRGKSMPLSPWVIHV